MKVIDDNISTLSLLSLMRISHLEEEPGSIYVCQGTIVGFLTPTNMPTYRIVVLNIGNGKETRVLIKETVCETLENYLNEITLLQCIGIYDFELELVLAYDTIALTDKEEIVFRQE